MTYSTSHYTRAQMTVRKGQTWNYVANKGIKQKRLVSDKK